MHSLHLPDPVDTHHELTYLRMSRLSLSTLRRHPSGNVTREEDDSTWIGTLDLTLSCFHPFAVDVCSFTSNSRTMAWNPGHLSHIHSIPSIPPHEPARFVLEAPRLSGYPPAAPPSAAPKTPRNAKRLYPYIVLHAVRRRTTVGTHSQPNPTPRYTRRHHPPTHRKKAENRQ